MSQHPAIPWLIDLATLSNGDLSVEATRPKLAAIATALCETLPPDAFTRKSLLAVAAHVKFFPTFGEVLAPLTAWWEENRPATGLSEDRDGLTPEDRAIIRNWQRHASGDWGKEKPERGDGAALLRELARYRHSHVRVFAELVESDDRARNIARQAGWLVAKIVPLRAAATNVPQVVRRGPPVEEAP